MSWMKFTQNQFEKISHLLPRQRGNVAIDNYTLLRGVLYMAENGCKWRALPEIYGPWDTVYKRVSRWAKNGVLDRVFKAMQKEKILAIKVEVLAVDSTSLKLHPDAHGALKKTENKPSASPKVDGIPSFMWSPQMTRLSWKCTFPAASATMRRRAANP